MQASGGSELSPRALWTLEAVNEGAVQVAVIDGIAPLRPLEDALPRLRREFQRSRL